MKLSDQKGIVDAVRRAGVVGAGGGGFPTHVKLAAKVDTVIANGSECEPLLATDKTIMKTRPDLVIDGLLIAMKATGATKGIIVVKGHYEDVVQSLREALPNGSGIELFLMDNYYPAGDEFLLVYDVTGRLIPEGGIPLNVGVVVDNVVTLMQIARAVHGEPVMQRAITVTGEVNSPGVVTAPIGTTYGDLIRCAGGFTIDDPAVIDGGPMMGKIVSDVGLGVAKTTSGIIVLPSDHFVVRTKSRTLSQEMKLSRAACCQCFRCSDLCPRNLLGHELYPHMMMRTINYQMKDDTHHVTSAFLCSQCGMCEMVACDIMRLSPRRMFMHLRERLSAAGQKSPHRRSGFSTREPYAYRKFPIPQLLKKIDMEKYYNRLDSRGELAVPRVRIALNRHTGVPARPVVNVGASVKRGDVIGEIPDDKLGARYHASISGKVTKVDNNVIEITT